MRNKKKAKESREFSYSPQSMQAELKDKVQLLETRIEASLYNSFMAKDDNSRWTYRVEHARELLTRVQDETERAGVELLLQQAEKFANGYSKIIKEEAAILDELFTQQNQVESSLGSITLLVEKESMLENLRASTVAGDMVFTPLERDDKERREIDVLISQAAGIVEARDSK